jgi:hypothetical protein
MIILSTSVSLPLLSGRLDFFTRKAVDALSDQNRIGQRPAPQTDLLSTQPSLHSLRKSGLSEK